MLHLVPTTLTIHLTLIIIWYQLLNLNKTKFRLRALARIYILLYNRVINVYTMNILRSTAL